MRPESRAERGWFGAAASLLAAAVFGCGGGGETMGAIDGDRLDASVRLDGAVLDATSPSDARDRDGGTAEHDAGTDATATCVDDAACDDADPCTIDRCTASGCEHVAVDDDGDGFGAGVVGTTMCAEGTDCDDADAAVHPGALELCNGRDENCDGAIDGGFECVPPGSEACMTACGSTGIHACDPATCSWGACEPPAETCDSSDEDCDGAVDEDFECSRFSSGSCPTTCGSTGTWSCSPTCTRSSCTPPAEMCNGLDDDCDGLTDETFTCAQAALEGCTSACGTAGARTCSATCSWGSCVPPAESCNGLDDDCDSMADDGFACRLGVTRSCTASCGTTGVQTCAPGCAWGPCVPPTEICNGTDDDCDGVADDAFECPRLGTGACTTACGTTGSRACSASCIWERCWPPAETCNGLDDDCDGLLDETFPCVQGQTGSCFTTCGSTGSRTCSSTCAWGSCAPPAEVCNGADDDCDGVRDDGFACVAGSTVWGCATACGTGFAYCSSSCTLGACMTPSETCNGIDDDCDGQVDEGLAYARAGTEVVFGGNTSPAVASTSMIWAVGHNTPVGVDTWEANVARLTLTGTLFAPSTLLTTSADRRLDLAWNGTDQLAAVHAGRSSLDVHLTRMDATGASLGTTRVSSTAPASLEPTVTWGGTEWLVAWRESAATGDVALQRVSTTGALLGPMTIIPTGRMPDLASSGSGYGLAWHRAGASPDVRFRSLNPDATSLSGEIVVATGALLPSIAWTGTEYAIVYWQGDYTRLARIRPDGSITGSTTITTSGRWSSGYTGVAWNGAELGVCWDDGSRTYFARFTATGSPVGAVQTVSANPGDCDVAAAGAAFGVAYHTTGGQIAFSRYTRCGR